MTIHESETLITDYVRPAQAGGEMQAKFAGVFAA